MLLMLYHIVLMMLSMAFSSMRSIHWILYALLKRPHPTSPVRVSLQSHSPINDSLVLSVFSFSFIYLDLLINRSKLSLTLIESEKYIVLTKIKYEIKYKKTMHNYAIKRKDHKKYIQSNKLNVLYIRCWFVLFIFVILDFYQMVLFFLFLRSQLFFALRNQKMFSKYG